MNDSAPEPAADSTDPLQPLVRAGAALIRSKLGEDPLNPHVFDEISVAAKAIHKACTALDPVLNLPDPKRATPLAPSTQTEGAGARTARELLEMFQQIATPKEPRQSRKDLMGAIVLAERAGLTEDAEKMRAELHGDDLEVEDDLLPPKAKVDRAHALLEEGRTLTERAKNLLAAVRPDQVAPEATEPAVPA